MAGGRIRKNRAVTDNERERTLKRRVIEERASAEQIWTITKPRNLAQKCADYLKDKTIDDHITYRILKGVLWGLKYGLKYYPQTAEEKYLETVGLNVLRQIISYIRRSKTFGFLSIGTGILHEDPNTKDLECVVCDMTTTQPNNSRRKSQVLESWEESRQQVQNTMIEGTELTVANALKPRAERQRLEREELDKRKRRKNRNAGGTKE